MYKVLVLDKYMGVITYLTFTKSDLRFAQVNTREYRRKYKLLKIKKVNLH